MGEAGGGVGGVARIGRQELLEAAFPLRRLQRPPRPQVEAHEVLPCVGQHARRRCRRQARSDDVQSEANEQESARRGDENPQGEVGLDRADADYHPRAVVDEREPHSSDQHQDRGLGEAAYR